MRVAVISNAEQKEEILMKQTNKDVEIIFIKDIPEMEMDESFEILFFLCEIPRDFNRKIFLWKHIFINSVTGTLEQNEFPHNCTRINGWPGFLRRPVWEVASHDKKITSQIFEKIGWPVIFVKDEPGLVAARVIGMIINEAFFALEDGVSTEEEMDLAMELGTNYPFGPFEWARKIGIRNIYHLLKTLSEKDKRYDIAPLLSRKYLELSA
jgi:3-hydroxybutyryl-CoA dehydrogenase